MNGKKAVLGLSAAIVGLLVLADVVYGLGLAETRIDIGGFILIHLVALIVVGALLSVWAAKYYTPQ